MAISLMKFLEGKWEDVRQYLRDDLDHIETAINTWKAATFTETNILRSTTIRETIPGDSLLDSRYISNQGASHSPMWEQVNLADGVQGDLPFANIVPATRAAILLGRGSSGIGDFEEITLGGGLSINGKVLRATVLQGPDGEDGNDGMPGPMGPAGPRGAAGLWWPGDAGDDGDAGMPGVAGVAGATGATGPAGPAGGPMGLPGVDGEDGDPGIPGMPGAAGAAGAPGATGPAGFGMQGADGDDGDSGLVLPTSLDIQAIQREAGLGTIGMLTRTAPGRYSTTPYAEGTWTPTDASGAGLVFTTVYTAQYRRVGNLVFVTFAINYPATASGLGAVIGGLPFTTAAAQFPLTVGFCNLGRGFEIFTQASDTTIFMFEYTGVQLTNANLSATAVRASGAYFL